MNVLEQVFVDEAGNVVDEPDFNESKVVDVPAVVTARYETEAEPVVEEVTITEYPNGGRDVEYRTVRERVGSWVWEKDGEPWEACPFEPLEWWDIGERYTVHVTLSQVVPLTDDERAEIEADREAATAERDRAETIQLLPDAVAELSCLVDATTTSLDDVTEAIAELSQLVSDIIAGE